jgi:hypothetical protein
MGGKIETHRDLEVYQKAFDAAMRIFELSKAFPKIVGMINHPETWVIGYRGKVAHGKRSNTGCVFSSPVARGLSAAIWLLPAWGPVMQ